MPRFVVRAAGPAFILAVTAVAWWAVGDQSEPHGDYGPTLRVPAVSHRVEPLVGAIAAAVAVSSAAILVVLMWNGDLDRRWVTPLGLLAVVGAVVGFAERTFTARVIGANLGEGMSLMFGAPLVAAAIAAVARTWPRRRR